MNAAKKSAAAKDRAPERPLADRLRHVFADEIRELERISRQLQEDRQRCHEAAREREQALAEEAALRAEIDALPLRHSQAQLADDEQEAARLRERHDALRGRLLEAERKREEAARALGGDDPARAESRAHQRAYARVTHLMREAAERRKELRAALEQGCSDFEARAGALLALGRVGTLNTHHRKEH